MLSCASILLLQLLLRVPCGLAVVSLDQWLVPDHLTSITTRVRITHDPVYFEFLGSEEAAAIADIYSSLIAGSTAEAVHHPNWAETLGSGDLGNVRCDTLDRTYTFYPNGDGRSVNDVTGPVSWCALGSKYDSTDDESRGIDFESGREYLEAIDLDLVPLTMDSSSNKISSNPGQVMYLSDEVYCHPKNWYAMTAMQKAKSPARYSTYWGPSANDLLGGCVGLYPKAGCSISYNPAGILPSSLQQLTSLKTLRLRLLGIATQPLPNWIGGMTALTCLDLSFNAFTGPLPTGLFQLTNLARLHLNDNQLTSSLPVGDKTSLRKVTLVDITPTVAPTPRPTQEDEKTNWHPPTPNIGQTFLPTIEHDPSGERSGLLPSIPLPPFQSQPAQVLQMLFPLDTVELINGDASAEIRGMLRDALCSAFGVSESQILSLTFEPPIYNRGVYASILLNVPDAARKFAYACEKNKILKSCNSKILQDQITIDAFYGIFNSASGLNVRADKPKFVALYDVTPTGAPSNAPAPKFDSSKEAAPATQLTFLPNMTSLATADFSASGIQGGLPGTTPPKLKSITLSSDCNSAFLPESICANSPGLQTIAMDGLRTDNLRSARCEQSYWSDDAGLQAFVLKASSSLGFTGKHPVLGTTSASASQASRPTIPACIFQMTALQSLHLSGNGLYGSLPETVTPTLTDLVISHNFLTGTIPAPFAGAPGPTWTWGTTSFLATLPALPNPRAR